MDGRSIGGPGATIGEAAKEGHVTLHDERVETRGTEVLERPPVRETPEREPFVRWIQWLGLLALVAVVVVGVVLLTDEPVTDTDGSFQVAEDARFARIGRITVADLAAAEDAVNGRIMTMEDLAGLEDMLGYDGFQIAEDARFARLDPAGEEG